MGSDTKLYKKPQTLRISEYIDLLMTVMKGSAATMLKLYDKTIQWKPKSGYRSHTRYSTYLSIQFMTTWMNQTNSNVSRMKASTQ